MSLGYCEEEALGVFDLFALCLYLYPTPKDYISLDPLHPDFRVGQPMKGSVRKMKHRRKEEARAYFSSLCPRKRLGGLTVSPPRWLL